MTMTDAEIRERSTLTLLRIIARQEDEIEGLRKTLASTAQAAADAERSASFYRRNTLVERNAALDEAWKRVDELRQSDSIEGYHLGVTRALGAIRDLGGMDPAKREQEA